MLYCNEQWYMTARCVGTAVPDSMPHKNGAKELICVGSDPINTGSDMLLRSKKALTQYRLYAWQELCATDDAL